MEAFFKGSIAYFLAIAADVLLLFLPSVPYLTFSPHNKQDK
jgi:hypothetical protein